MIGESTKTLSQILDRIYERPDLAHFVKGCRGEVLESGAFGSYWNSIISTYVIHAPVDQYVELKKIVDDEQQILMNAVLDLHPPGDDRPEITSLEIRVLNTEDAQDSEEDMTATEEVSDNFDQSMVRVFISYSSNNKEFCGVIKRYLESFGIDVFLAHDDIDPGSEWEYEILQSLKRSDVFIPVFTEPFSASAWTDQECGIAFADNKEIVPVGVGKQKPYGFLARYQAVLGSSDHPKQAARRIVSVLRQMDQFKGALLKGALASFKDSNSFEEAKQRARLLRGFEGLSVDHVEEMVEAALRNNQILHSYGAIGVINQLVARFEVDQNLLHEYQNKRPS